MEKPESSSMKTDNSCLVDQNQCKIDSAKTRSKSATRDDSKSSEPSGLFMDVLERGGDESFRDSLDGVKKGQEAKRSFRKKRNKSQNSLENTHEQCEEKNHRVQGQSDVPENTWVNEQISSFLS
ncbi:hypothetical protein WA026_000654 [Henosepilachna vigintioctopunctata]|uniref:Uncharacterized protein n=1 Tax=Henosepilachna vigintioctopunctata TaxID=420089 RepID=A0AAW1V4J0_9CUCU